MTEHESTTTEEETTETRLILPPIDYAAPGSRRLEKERARYSQAYLAGVNTYNETIDDLNEARDAVIAEPNNETAVKRLERELQRHKDAKLTLDEAREAYHQHLIARMTTSDGSSVEDALDLISQNDFLALVRSDVESVTIPKPGAASSSGG